MPGRPAAGRDEDAITAWREATWGGNTRRAATGAFICFEDEVGVNGRPSKGRLSVAGLLCYRPGLSARSCYRLRGHTGRKSERRSLGGSVHIRLLDRPTNC